MAKNSAAFRAKVELVMKEFAAGRLKSSSGKKVTDAKVAEAIAYSEARAHTQAGRKTRRKTTQEE